jgi:activator of 2-hydroxyglutaryl-CoA dehydratase
MFSRVDAIGPTVMTGGGARNFAIVHLLGELLKSDMFSSEHSQIAGAIGCAVSAAGSAEV